MTKQEKKELKNNAIETLKRMFEKQKRAYTRLDYCAPSGMSRRVSVFIPTLHDDGTLGISNITYYIAHALGARRNKNDGGIVMGGCGYCVGNEIINNLNYVLYGVMPLAADETRAIYIKQEWM